MSFAQIPPDSERTLVVEGVISETLLKAGVPAAMCAMVLGVLQYIFPVGALPIPPVSSPYSVCRLGLLVLMSLPIFRVGAAFIAFADEQDPVLMSITGAVLVVLMWSFHIAFPF